MNLTPAMLLDRLTKFAEECRDLTAELPRNSHNIIYTNQLTRSSSSPGANYIEAIEATSPKEFVLRLKICRKELRESDYWLNLIKTSNSENTQIVSDSKKLREDATELIKIFTASIITSERNQKIHKMEK